MREGHSTPRARQQHGRLYWCFAVVVAFAEAARAPMTCAARFLLSPCAKNCGGRSEE
jgi:hypothetical protein